MDSDSTGNVDINDDQSSQVNKNRRPLSASKGVTSAELERVKRQDKQRALSAGERKQEAISQANAQVGATLLEIIHKRKQSKEDGASNDEKQSSVSKPQRQEEKQSSEGKRSRSRPSSAKKDGRGESRKSSAASDTPRQSRSVVDLPMWDSEIIPLLSELERTSYEDVPRLCEVCATLWSKLEQHRLLGRSGGVGGSKKRASVLRTVFRLLDHKDPNLLLRVARIIIGVS